MIQASLVNGLGPSHIRSPFVSHDPDFGAVLGDAPRLVRVVATNAHEGPVYVPSDDALLFTSLPRRGTSPGFPHPVVAVRRLVVCEQGTGATNAAITRDGRVLAFWNGMPLNSPTDIVVKSDGSVWFTDPSYGWLQDIRPEPLLDDNVYRWDPCDGSLRVMAGGFDMPNGLCFSPDEHVLYCPRERQHHFELLRFARWCPVAFTRLVSIFPGVKHDAFKMKIATGAEWTFLVDEDLEKSWRSTSTPTPTTTSRWCRTR